MIDPDNRMRGFHVRDTEMTTEERAMGAFILPMLTALQVIPAVVPGVQPL